MAHYLKFFIALVFSVLGLYCAIHWSNWMGFSAFIGFVIIGSVMSSHVFKKYATHEQIKEDIKAGLVDR